MNTERPDLTAVLEHYGVQVNTMRVTSMVACPLHEDNTPSCSINLDRQLWRCHSCNGGGSSWDLIMAKEETDFRGARAIAASVGFAAGAAGGGDEQVSGSAYGGRRAVAGRKGNQPGHGSYRPSWRR
ncbi:CHC2 zinc finger domain-containing protein [Catenuloplanes sp. NPDC051500]|uniref:CHC2 zinc finger domain-containing protein n=1 Tax=Catenuloplanes sp. NPDC051500 TaxID=3363959 RepID=UPI0037B35348